MTTLFYWHKRVIAYLLLITMPASLTLTFVGCSGNSGDSQTSTFILTTTPQDGILATGEIGGEGLTVVTASGTAAPVGTGGAFRVQVSDQGAQLLLARDKVGVLHGFGLNIPTARNKRGTPLNINAESTALGLLFLTPGIIACDPEEAAQRTTELKSLVAFSPFVEYLKTTLPNTALESIVKNSTQFAALEKACIEEWFLGHPVNSGLPKTRSIEGIASYSLTYPADNYDGNIILAETPANVSPYADPVRSFDLINNGWRFVEVYRRDIVRDSATTEWNLVSKGLGSVLKGVNGYSIGSMLTGQAKSGSSITDTVPRIKASKSEYYIVGPGFRTPDITAPSDLPTEGYNAFGCTVIWTVALPIISLLGGLGDLFKKLDPALLAATSTQLWDTVGKSTNLRDTFGAIYNDVLSGTQSGLLSGLTNFSMTLLGAIVSSGKLVPILGLIGVAPAAATSLAAVIAPALALTTVVCTEFNFLSAYDGLASYPPITRFTVEDYHVGVILDALPPEGGTLLANGEDALTLTATVKRYTDAQDPLGTAEPAGALVRNAQITFTTSLGTIREGQTPQSCQMVTNDNGQAIIHLTSTSEGQATMEVKVLETHSKKIGSPTFSIVNKNIMVQFSNTKATLTPQSITMLTRGVQAFTVKLTTATPIFGSLRYIWSCGESIETTPGTLQIPGIAPFVTPVTSSNPIATFFADAQRTGKVTVKCVSEFKATNSTTWVPIATAHAQITVLPWDQGILAPFITWDETGRASWAVGVIFDAVPGHNKYNIRGYNFNDTAYWGTGFDRSGDISEYSTVLGKPAPEGKLFFFLTGGSGWDGRDGGMARFTGGKFDVRSWYQAN
ncbi:MAG: hypothetical protein WCJ56_05260 [bacterium]